MTATNFPAFLAFVWQPQFDSPHGGPHTTPHDPGGLTFGGITAAAWHDACACGLVKGDLAGASTAELSTILSVQYWGGPCDALPPGLDFALANGRMMSGYFPRIFQQCLGLIGHTDVDGWIGPRSVALAKSREPETFLDALAGAHAYYLSTLTAWEEFGDGWTTRIEAARKTAIRLTNEAPVA